MLKIYADAWLLYRAGTCLLLAVEPILILTAVLIVAYFVVQILVYDFCSDACSFSWCQCLLVFLVLMFACFSHADDASLILLCKFLFMFFVLMLAFYLGINA